MSGLQEPWMHCTHQETGACSECFRVVIGAVERLTRERDEALASATRGWEQADSLHMSVAEALRERDEARAACTLAWQRICAERRWAYDPAMDPVEALRSRLDPESAFYEAFSLDSADAFAARTEKAERERDEVLREKAEQLDDSERIIAALVKERDEARALLQAATDNAFDAGAKAQGLEDSHRFVAMRKERDEARADYERARADFLRCAETQRAAFADAATDADLLRAENERLRGLIAQVEWVSGGYIMGPPSCPWCEGQMEDGHTPDCPAFSARGEVRR